MKSTRPAASLTAAAVIALSLSAPILAGSALATPDDSSGLESQGSCSSGSRWNLEVEPEHGGSKVSWKLRADSGTQTWAYTIDAGDAGSFSGTASSYREGRTEVEKETSLIAVGTTVTATAEDTATGETCQGSLVVGSSAGSSGQDDDHVSDRESECTTAATVSLRVKDKRNRVRVRFVVDSDDAGEKWNYRLKRSGRTVMKGAARTKGANGRFAVKKRLPANGGKVFKLAAQNRSDDDRCRVRVRH